MPSLSAIAVLDIGVSSESPRSKRISWGKSLPFRNDKPICARKRETVCSEQWSSMAALALLEQRVSTSRISASVARSYMLILLRGNGSI